MEHARNTQNKSKVFFYKICKYSYILGSPNYWYEEFNYSKFTRTILDNSSYVTSALVCILIVTEWAALFTQNNLDAKQVADLTLFSISHPLLHFNAMYLGYEKQIVRKILYDLVVKFKEVYHDPEVEIQMIKKSKFYSVIFSFFVVSSVVSYGLDAAVQVLTKEKTFTTLITVWPDVTDKGTAADVARGFIFLVWWVFIFRMSAVFWLVIPTTVCLNHHFKTLCSYFYSLNGIFEKDLTQEEKEKKYEAAFKVGIKLHTDILACTREHQNISKTVFGGQVIMTVAVLSLQMSQMQIMKSQHTMGSALSIILTATSVLLATGCLMWNAGDVTVEAAQLPTAMFESGWHHCHKSSRRIRPLLVIAMAVSQQPVILKTFGAITISYGSYVTIVKTSYSLFSVLY